jgi:hypothetical protein
MKRRDYEESIEQRFCINLTKWSREHGILVTALKLNLTGRRGWPDRLIMWEGGNLLFIEFKRPGEEPRKLQVFIHGIIRDLGFEVEVYDDAHIALGRVQAKIRATAPPTKEYEIGGERSRVQVILEAWEGQDGGSPEGLRHPEEKRSR